MKYLSIHKILKISIVLIVIKLAFLPYATNAQDAHFSQYYAAPLYLNPALTGLEKDIVVGLNYRSQWNSLGFPYTTGQFSIIHPIFKKGVDQEHLGGLGLSLYNDVSGDNGSFKTFGANLSGAYNYTMPFDKRHAISAGFQAGFYQRRLDVSELRWGSQYNSLIGFDDRMPGSGGNIAEQSMIPVVNAGIIWYYNPDEDKYLKSEFRAFGGIAASNINNPDESLYQDGSSNLPVLYKLHGGIDLKIVRGVKISPNILVMHQGYLYQVNIGNYLTVDVFNNPYTKLANQTKVLLGVWHRVNDAFIFSTGLQTKNVTAGISYDINSSSLRQQTRGRGAMEISVSYRIIKGNNIRRTSTPLL